VIDPTLDATHAFLDAFMLEFGSRFPDNVMHFGGDEVSGKREEEGAWWVWWVW
jgi:N-acetyl-beta-hexosaminidase